MIRLFFLLIVFSFLFLFSCPLGLAQGYVYSNQVGLYLTSDGFGAMGTDQIGVPVSVFLVLKKPEDSAGTPFTGITAFDCQLNFYPPGQMFYLGENLPGGGTNVGDTENCPDGYVEFMVEYAEEVPVIDEVVMLVSFMLMNLNMIPVEVTLGPASTPGIPGEMSFFHSSFSREAMYPISGSTEAPVFFFNGCCVSPVEITSFGSIKALYQ